MSSEEIKPRHIPLLSRIMFLPAQICFAGAHMLISSTVPRLEAPLSIMTVTAFFVVMPLVMIAFFGTLGAILEAVGICNLSVFWNWIVGPFCAVYFIQIILLDQTHTQVFNSGALPATNSLQRASEAFLNAWLGYIENYITCVPWAPDAKLPTGPNVPPYVFGCHPHGIHCHAIIELSNLSNGFATQFPNVSGPKLTGLAATVVFKIPVVRELFLYMGYIDASRQVASKALKEGQSIFVCVGGEAETLLTTRGKDILVLHRRKGFVRLALSHGASLVPVLGLGSNEAYTTYSYGLGLRKWISKNFGVALPIFHGRWGTPLPHPIPIQIVIGEPIPTPPPKTVGAKPDNQLVDEYHAKYIDAIRKLHAKHASKDVELIIQ